MTLAVMTRATLGHTGQALEARPSTQVIYGLVFVAALLRIAASFTGSIVMLEFAGFAWIAGFACFIWLYAPLLALRRPAWRDARC